MLATEAAQKEMSPPPKGAPRAGAAAPKELEELLALIRRLPSMPSVTVPAPAELRRLAEEQGNLTEFGNYNFCSTVRNRSAGRTVYIGEGEIPLPKPSKLQEEILRNVPKTLKEVIAYLPKVPLYSIDLTMGQNTAFTPHCHLYISRYRRDYVRLAYMVYQTLFPRAGSPGPELTVVDLPEWQEQDRQILVFPDEGLTVGLGSDYYGEIKKGFLRMGMWHAKRRGMLGLHAGSKIIHARTPEGEIRRIGMIIFGLTATGKTTHSCHNHGLDAPGELVRIVQDDVVFLREDAAAFGTERGFYIKTDGLHPVTQPLLYKAATARDAILENIMVDHTGKVDFQDETLTGNGRGIIQRDDLGEYRADSLNLPPLAELDLLIMAFITRRNTVLPIATKLTPSQAAAAFMLGESVESTGGDPKRAGESVRVVGTNPFIVGDEAKEGNWFYDFLHRHEGKVECYQLNTGGVGEIVERAPDGTKRIVRKVTRVEILEMAAIIRGICRNTIHWVPEPDLDLLVPKAIEGVNMERFALPNFYTPEQTRSLIASLQKERCDYLGSFVGLHPDIVGACKLVA